jgi:predicted AlkP superfamily pyrophosphatase or phosphodiesterase
MLTGLCPADHGVDWNDYEPDRGYAQVDSIFAAAHDQGLKTVFIIGKQKLSQITRPETLTQYLYVNDRDTVLAKEAAPLLSARFDLALVHFPTIDMMGHEYGWMSPEQMSVARRADEALATLLAALDEGGLRASTLIIITADHGGHDTTHGTNRADDMTIPWVMVGPGVEPQELLNPVNIADTAATAAWILKLPYGGKAVGQPILEGFGLPVSARPVERCP